MNASYSADPMECSRDGERFRLLIQQSSELYAELTPELEVVYVSANVEAVLGYAPKELIGTHAFVHVHPEDRARLANHFVQPCGQAGCRFRHSNGSWRNLEGRSRGIQWTNGVVRNAVVVRDVTALRAVTDERDRLQTELSHAERLAALGILAGGMAHDFNNILMAIIGTASLARFDPKKCPPAEALDSVLKAAERAKLLTQQVLEFNRPQQVVRAPVKLSEVVEEVLNLLRVSAGPQIELRGEYSAQEGPIFGSSSQLHQLVLNLCQNALHALAGRGRVVLTVEPVQVGELIGREPAGLRTGPYMRLTVADDGHGMDAATLRRIFEPFFTTKPAGRGTGLGLAVVQRVVQEHGGVLHVTSEPARGTTFQIYFPAGPR